jgi:hypothetical protein
MRRLTLLLTAFLAIVAVSSTARPARAQGIFDAVKKKADAARKAADEVKRKADSTSAAAAKAKAAADSAKTAASNAKTSVENAASAVTSGVGGAAATPPSSGAKPTQAAPPKSGRPGPPATGAAASASSSAPASGGAQSLSRSAAHVDEQVVFAGEPGSSFAISPRGQHVAGRTLKGSRTVMVYDGVAGPPFDEIPGVPGEANMGGAFSDDGSHHAYVGRQGTQWVVMEDGKEVGRGAPFFQGSGNQTIAWVGFTPGSKHLYYIISDGDHHKFQMYFDGKPDPVIQDPMQPVFSPDGEHYAYVFQVNKETGLPKPALMVDGKRATYVGGDPKFTADGLHLYTTMGIPNTSAIDVLLDGKPIMRVGGVGLHMAPAGSAMLATVLSVTPAGRLWFLTIGNKRVPNSDCHGSGGINGVYFSADAKHWAVRCEDSNTSNWVMTDGKKGQEYQRVASDVAFTADGRPVYLATANGKQFIIVGDQEYGPYVGVQPQGPGGVINSAAMSAAPVVIAGNRVAFIAMEPGAQGGNRVVVVDGKAIKSVNPDGLGFSPDGSHFAYTEGQASRSVVIDGVRPAPAPVAHETGDVPAQFTFSQDGKHLAFASFSGQARAVAVDDGVFATDALASYDVTFTPDGKHLVWLGGRSGNRLRVYVDGEPVLESDQPATSRQSVETWWNMGGDGVLTYLAQDGGVLKRFRVTPGSSSIEARARR